MKPNLHQPPTKLSRRNFLSQAARSATLTALFAGLPKGWVGRVYADDSPETATLNFGMIALTDCSPIVIAHEKGLFKKYGVNSTVTKGANWAAIRDNLSSGTIQATHMLIGMPLASTMGLAGSPKKPMIIPWLMNRNGQAISLKTEWAGKVGADPKAIKPFVDQANSLGEPLTFAMTFPPGTHAMWMRYYLGAGGHQPGQGREPDRSAAGANGGEHEDWQNGRLLCGRAVERPRDRGQGWFYLRKHAGYVEGSPGKSLRLSGGVCR